MKAKIGNIIVDVWKINRDDSESDYAPWLKSAIEKNLVGWSAELADRGNLSGVLWKKYLKGGTFVSSHLKEQGQPLADRFEVTSYGPFPVIGAVGDYLIYSEELPERYRIISEKKFEKEYQIIA